MTRFSFLLACAAAVMPALCGPGSASYLGIGVAEVTTDRAKALKLSEERGVEITRVAEDSPAERGGLRTGDVVLEYQGERIEGLEQFMRLVRETPAGREVKLSVSRGGALQTVMVKTGARPEVSMVLPERPWFSAPNMPMPDVPRANMTWRSVSLGVEGEALESQLASFFGVKEGVLVRSVVKGSPAEKAGLKAGDVITKVDDTAVSSPREITSALRSAGLQSTAMITAVREKKEATFSVTFDEAPMPGSPGKKISAR